MQTTEYLKVKFPYRPKSYFGQVIFEDQIRTLSRRYERARDAEAHARAVVDRYNRLKEVLCDDPEQDVPAE